MGIERLSPVAPVSLPEFGTSTGWLMCRNALCPNFGVYYDGPPPDERTRSVSDARYRLDTAKKSISAIMESVRMGVSVTKATEAKRIAASALSSGCALLSSWALLGWFPFIAVSMFAGSAPSAPAEEPGRGGLS